MRQTFYSTKTGQQTTVDPTTAELLHKDPPQKYDEEGKIVAALEFRGEPTTDLLWVNDPEGDSIRGSISADRICSFATAARLEQEAQVAQIKLDAVAPPALQKVLTGGATMVSSKGSASKVDA